MKHSNEQNSYTMLVKKNAGWKNHDTARLQISVGQHYHEGEKFLATANWLRPRFKKVIVCVNDTLQRFNFCFEKGLPDKIAHQLTQSQGDAWLSRNMPALKTLPDVQIYRWDEWRAREDFSPLHENLISLYAEKADMRASIDDIVQSFWERRCARLGFSEDERFLKFKKFSTDYLLEETAAFILMFKEKASDIYPGSVLLPFTLIKKYYPDALDENLSGHYFTQVSFARNKQAEKLA